MRKTFRKPVLRLPVLIVAILAGLHVMPDRFIAGSDIGAETAPGGVPAIVTRVHDGDTISVLVGRKTDKIRLIGIDAPELAQRPWGERAKTHLRELLGDGKVMIVTDVEKRDRYKRLLAYVWSGGKFVNLEMVRDGYAVLYTFPPNVRYADPLRAAQSEAREKERGIWIKGGLDELPREYRKKHPRR